VDRALGTSLDNSPDPSKEANLAVDSGRSEKYRNLNFVSANGGQIVDRES
jgi:hypothetical protein